MKQTEVLNFDNLNDYLNERRLMWKGLYHYTGLETLIRILRSGRLLLNCTANLNDNMECKADSNFPDCKLYVGSLTYESREDVHYWAIYGRGDHFSLRIRFDPQTFSNPDSLEFIDDDGNDIAVRKTTVNDVIYCQPKRTGYLWKHHNYGLSINASPEKMDEQFVGMWKYAVWEHEKETRILATAKTNAPRIYMKLTVGMLDSMSITFNPWLSEEVRPDIAKLLSSIFFERYGIKKSNLQFKRSSIYNQIKQM